MGTVSVDLPEVDEFIKRRFPIDCAWKNGNCWWFAEILCTRFPMLDIYYDPVNGHFVAGTAAAEDGSLDDVIFYDWGGQCHPEKPQLWDKICEEDLPWAQRLVRDCIK